DPADLKRATNGRLGAAEALASEGFRYVGHFGVGRFIFLIEESAVDQFQVANVAIGRLDSQHEHFLCQPSGEADALMHFEHNGSRSHGGDAFDNGLFVVVPEKVSEVIDDRAGTSAGVADLDEIGADGLDLPQDELPASGRNGDHQDYRGSSDDHAQGGQGEADL